VADLTVAIERQGDRVSVAVAGELDLGTVDQLEQAVAGELAAGAVAELVVDLGGVSFVDSSGLGALLRIRQATQQAGGQLILTGVNPGPARVIGIAGLSGTFGLPER
jgi:anti-anti-sigma factor